MMNLGLMSGEEQRQADRFYQISAEVKQSVAFSPQRRMNLGPLGCAALRVMRNQ